MSTILKKCLACDEWTSKGQTAFKFPKKYPEWCGKWKEFANLPDDYFFKPSDALCADHFREEDMVIDTSSGEKIRRLKLRAEPCQKVEKKYFTMSSIKIEPRPVPGEN